MTRGDFDRFAERLSGRVLLPGSEGFDFERGGADPAFRHEPDVIVCAETAEDIQEAVRFAAERDMPIAVQATGHGLARPARGGVLLSTRRMSHVDIDSERQTATVGAGTRFGQLIPLAAEHGLAPLSGSSPGVGVVGYTLAGGLSLLTRTHGWAADSVRSLDLVTADGALRTVTPESDPELFRALFGGRDNFGVVARLEIGLVPVVRLFGGGFFFDGEAAGRVLNAWSRWTRDQPPEMNSSAALISFPDAPDMPPALRGRDVLHVRIAYTGTADDGRTLVEPLRQAGPLLLEDLRDMPFTQSATIHNDPPVLLAAHADTALLERLDEATVDTLLTMAAPSTGWPTAIEIRHLGAAATDPSRAIAVADRNAEFLLSLVTLVDADITCDKVADLYDRALAALAPVTRGAALNFLGAGADPHRLRAAYSEQDFAFLQNMKRTHDPKNLFRNNHTIPAPDPDPDPDPDQATSPRASAGAS
ncbi:FAD-binding oxidoreductase [Streptomyces subrutilus]|uniref:FAD-binding oxidoreductase n=1 Tax=Streptomyces subrutilus TaxID=36818 RepID=UPI002E0DC759|nr:FAD-binding oxidoreductase [Streptomyces subrutilus]